MTTRGLFRLLPGFALAWAIAFAATLGVASGLAQLYPQIVQTPHVSVVLTVISGLAAVVYGWSRAKPDPLPVNDLLPDVLSTIPSYSLECTTERTALCTVHDLTEDAYPGVQSLPTDRYEQWLLRNPYVFVCLFNQHRQVRGYFDIFAFRDDFMSLFINGTVGEQEIRHEHILPPAEAQRAERLYLGGIAVRDWQRYEGKRNAAILLWGMLQYFDHYFPDPPPRTLFAQAVTPQGEDLLKRFKFRVVSEAAGRRDPYRLYAVQLDKQFRDLVRANVPEYSAMVNLSWRVKRSLTLAG